jgi:hypothetical protein
MRTGPLESGEGEGGSTKSFPRKICKKFSAGELVERHVPGQLPSLTASSLAAANNIAEIQEVPLMGA